MRRHLLCRAAALLALLPCRGLCSTEYLVGVGKADITGPAADINLMGYANPTQIVEGIHIRQFARSFIVAEAARSERRFAFVNLDACMASQAVTFTVIARLKERYGDLYSEANVALSGTHTHSGPAGYLQYLVYDITGLGFYQQTFDGLVEGIVRSIAAAHESLAPGRLSMAAGDLLDANINRSPTAYMENPKEERDLYAHNIDKEMALLRLDDESGRGRAAFSWYPVHGTSMNNTNTLISGDNKGAAAQLMEGWAARQADPDAPPGFVAAFCQANVGDTSPNTLGPVCMDTGEPCDAVHSTCGGRVQQCVGRGPGWPDDVESTRIIGAKQADKAQQLWAAAPAEPVSGGIDYRHVFLDMRGRRVAASAFTRPGATCKPAMGFAFAAGTTDGPGAFDFKQGDTNGSAFWYVVRNFITTPTAEQIECHKPKPILLDVGEMHFPYEWVPYIVEVQILRVGQLAILAVPGELTTMAGRRLKRAVASVVEEAWGPGLRLVISGLTNTYSSYVTTWEEYQVQRYEGGFTLFGPHTLDAYIQEFMRMARAMVAGEGLDPGPPPPNQLAKARQWSLVPPVIADAVPSGKQYGDVYVDVEERYAPGSTVTAVFHSACPRNDVRASGTFLAVERRVALAAGAASPRRARPGGAAPRAEQAARASGGEGGEAWEVVHTDNDWCTRFRWARPHALSPYSYATLGWVVPGDAAPGTYRLRHLGNYKRLLGGVYEFEGVSSEFEVVGPAGAGQRRGGSGRGRASGWLASACSWLAGCAAGLVAHVRAAMYW